jgi:hypothetical protein
MGHRVVHTSSACWFNVSPGIYTNFPYHLAIEATVKEIDQVLGMRGLAARYLCSIENGQPSYRIVCDKKNYDFSSLSTKARNQTRRGLERCQVKRLGFGKLDELGAMAVNRDTRLRQEVPYKGNAIGAAIFLQPSV